ncbi:hypothetical protein [uncultured Cohaesibacter sp.]|uniref:hypothetical protein n=1 Tax=uncultured Cohaesibacter sp. TaxID=1002546 RepID=UPI002930B041|nr:hypothetical protein [uncultured Cohaesibacter sp.]
MNKMTDSGQGRFACFTVKPGETLTAWSLSSSHETPYPGDMALAEDRVQYRFINGFVDVGDLPCRKALWQDVANRTVALETDWKVESINLPGFNRRLDFSGFSHRPTRLKRWCGTILKPKADGNYDFRLATCGGVHIWVDGVLAAKFEPFSRNNEQQTDISLPLKEAGSDVVMLCEDLAERDVDWHVEVTLLGPDTIDSLIDSSADASVIDELMALARDIRPEREFCSSGPLRLKIDKPASLDVTISARVLPSVHLRDNPLILSSTTTLKAGDRIALVEGIDAMPDAYHALDLVFEVGETKVVRQIAFALLRKPIPQTLAPSLQERKQQALLYAADHGEVRIGRALAILATGRGCTEICRTLIETTLASIDERLDCSDFIMVPLLWLYGAYRDQLPEDLSAKIKKSVLNYRYWVDEPGNDVMWFWSENHVLCFHTSQYLSALLLEDETFVTSGRTGTEQLKLAEDRLSQWFSSIEGHGFAEWNSAAYYPIDFIGLLALQHWGKGSVSERAAALLGRLFKMIGLHTLAGVPAGSMGRAYDKELRAGPCTELAPFATVAFGQGWFNDGVAALTMFCIGNYEPPSELADLVFPSAGMAVEAHYVQGYNIAARLALYKTASVQLSASVDSPPGTKGHQQHMLDIRFAGHPFARAWVNHPGEDDPWGHQRPSYWAGNGSIPRVAQHENVAMMLFDIPEDHRIDFTHIYAPLDAYDDWCIRDNWLVLRSQNGFAALRPDAPLEMVDRGPGENREFISRGRKAAWVAIVGDLEDGAGLETILDMLSQLTIGFDKDKMLLTLERPDRPTLHLSYEKGLSIDTILHPFPSQSLEPVISVKNAVSLKHH